MNFMERIRAKGPGAPRKTTTIDVEVAALQSDLLAAVDLLFRCQIFNLGSPSRRIAHTQKPSIKVSYVARASSGGPGSNPLRLQNDHAPDSRHAESSTPQCALLGENFLSRGILRSPR